ncbi:MAG: UvrD-helicase domain-containing protein [Candidatus Paracaedimonas acanthamoebae]|uniref:DNA 3'-5' helicase n=1 Tax=Candidatus Paracaedimonas acanthamoebae TaxID=244581 RepID=A0A8J7TVC0_9PROT|nr:UvrD-helicase domain-containing protein [Candidatus Paracaedimonas acanthamoebae]
MFPSKELQASSQEFERENMNEQHLNNLNEAQRIAVETINGPVLVLAGAGTGKTRVLTSRIAHILLHRHAWPSQILAVTFTNKASQEMKERLNRLIGHSAEGLWLGTFHSLCVRILRHHSELIGLKSNFTILDTDDQLRLIKQLLKAEELDDKRYPPRQVLGAIGRWKDRGLLPEKVTATQMGKTGYVGDENTLKIYKDYQQRLQILNTVDFGDLLLLTVTLFTTHQNILKTYQEQFKYILVDEYQDTNIVQYLWLRLLAMGNQNNLCCVGDDDQSIYGWRGAEIGNILKFEQDFPGAKIIRLEENYRSTPQILGAASTLISHNNSRLGKTLRTQRDGGELVQVRGVWDGEEEARFVGEEIENFHRKNENLSSIAILVRASFQMREFEDRFITLGVPYRVIGGPRFYERQEIRDALAYLRVVIQPNDSLAFERIINTPRRGIGNSTLQTLHAYARINLISLVEATRILLETDELRGQAKAALNSLLLDFDRWRNMLEKVPPKELTGIILDESGYTAMWLEDKSPDAPGRLENLKEFAAAVGQFEGVASFLEHVSLVMENSAASQGDMVSLMTLHAAKGLEFDTVFLAGWEEGVFPNPRALTEAGEGGLEEERRLAYVGLTRAKKRAIITFAVNRRLPGEWQSSMPSRFIDELAREHIEVINQPGIFGRGRRGWDDAVTLQESSRSGISYSQIAPKVTTSPFSLGDRVFHIKFGYGRVTEISGDKLDVHFEHTGLKKVMSSFVVRK